MILGRETVTLTGGGDRFLMRVDRLGQSRGQDLTDLRGPDHAAA